jgi:diadenosine tetraphosphatase ApaH/serine/threonine PP2A family protein phosphatase
VNQVFDRLPLAGVIDHDIFCIHGGIPRPVPDQPNAIQAILSMPNVAAVNPCYEHETEWTQQIASDCIWSDPATEDMEQNMDEDGFGPSLRGGDCVCFGNVAIDNFLVSNNLSFIIRAHEAHAHGVSLSKSARLGYHVTILYYHTHI